MRTAIRKRIPILKVLSATRIVCQRLKNSPHWQLLLLFHRLRRHHTRCYRCRCTYHVLHRRRPVLQRNHSTPRQWTINKVMCTNLRLSMSCHRCHRHDENVVDHVLCHRHRYRSQTARTATKKVSS